jgi:tetratricopeptide (TPR) repeat protein
MYFWPAWFVTTILIMISFANAPALANDWSACISASDDGDTAACTRLIESKKYRRADLARIYTARGLVRDMNGDHDGAIADYNEAIRLNPKHAPAVAARGMAYNTKNEYDRAITDFNEAIRLDPKFALTYAERGLAYNAKGDYDRAITDFSEAIRLNPKYAIAFAHRGGAYHYKGDYNRAISDANEAIRVDPKYSDAFDGRGNAYRAKGDVERAMADYDQAIRLDPKNASPFTNRGHTHLKLGHMEHALADLNEAIRLAPTEPEAYSYRGIIWESKGDIDRARSDYDAALARTTYDPEARQAQQGARERLAVLANMPNAPAGMTTSAVSSTTTARPTVTADPGRRVALVVGNSAYGAVPELRNPRRDGQAFAEALRGVGFQTVMLEKDLTREKFVSVLRSFAAEAETADWAVIYFAGHGIEVGGTNYLIPVDARLVADRDVQFEAVSLDQVLGAVEGARKLRLARIPSRCGGRWPRARWAVASPGSSRDPARWSPMRRRTARSRSTATAPTARSSPRC